LTYRKKGKKATNDALIATAVANVANIRGVIKNLILKLSRREIK
jgi:hypothetical protein